MQDIDHTIKELLGLERARLFDAFGRQSLWARVRESFSGESRWLVGLTFLAIVVFVGLAVLGVAQFLQATDLREALLWGAAAGSCIFAVGLMKVWYWMELNKNTVVRELKRLELQVAWLSRESRGGHSNG